MSANWNVWSLAWAFSSKMLIHVHVYTVNSDISNSVFTNTWCKSKCYQGPNVTPLHFHVKNKLGYIELYISKTRIYQSFSEIPCHWNQCKLPFIYQSSKSSDQNQLNLLSFVINTSKSIETSQFLGRHIPFIYRNTLEHIEGNQHFTVSLLSKGAIVSIIAIPSWLKRTMIGLFFTASSLSWCKNKNIMLNKWFRLIE